MAKDVVEMSTEASVKEKSMEWTPAEKEGSKKKYGCEILIENGTWEQVTGKEFPNDARIVTYYVDGERRYDLTRSSKVSRIFDMYWDKFREGIKKIEFGYGRYNPKLWGIEPKKEKKRK